MTDEMKPLFGKVTIVGAGLIGGSLGIALRGRGLARTVVGVGHRQISIDRAIEMGAITEGTLDVTRGVKDADLVVLGTAIGLIIKMGEKIAGHLKPGCIVTDVGSTKSEIVSKLTSAMPDGVFVVGAHPIAGSERRGIDAAFESLFDGTTCVITPTDRTDPTALDLVTEMWTRVGALVSRLSPEQHDAILARTSHLPHMAAAVLVSVLKESDSSFVGTGLHDTTRVASGDVGIWCDVLLTNREAALEAIDALTDRFSMFRSAIESGDAETLTKLLAESKTRRDGLWPDGSSQE